MKLEIKHITPYLPYKLRAEILDYKSDYVGNKYDEICGVHQWDKSYLLWSLLTHGGAKPSCDRIKPILVPLKDIKNYQEIMDEFSEYSYEVFENHFFFVRSANCFNAIDYTIALLCFKNHIDIFGLIDAGLAVDINTLEK